ncbi:MAG: hypothetical protein KatS3mg022_1174 [Armatimonadota bacterium]|nr:MAG: hypothetical protein KatS3mg022_1174 [Armatimonadota bacterium]
MSLRHLRAVVILVLVLGAVQAVAQMQYPVKHLPMLEKLPCYVLPPADWGVEEIVWLLKSLIITLEEDARATDKRKTLVIVSDSVTEATIGRMKAEIEKETSIKLERVALSRTSLSPEVVRKIVDDKGVRFVFVNTLQKKQLSAEIVEQVKAVSKQGVDLLNPPEGQAGFRVCWQWGQKKKENQMWVIVYAPGLSTMHYVLGSCLSAVAHDGGNQYREPSDAVEVALWAFVADDDVWKHEQRLKLTEWIESRALKQFPLIEAKGWLRPEDLSADTRQVLDEEGWNYLFLVTRENLASLNREAAEVLAPLKQSIDSLSASQSAVLVVERGPAKVVCYVAPTIGLLRRLVNEHKDFMKVRTVKIDVPDLSWVRRVAVAFTKHAVDTMPQGARSRLLAELKRGLPYWQIYDESVLSNLLRLEEISIHGLPGGATIQRPQQRVTVDALLVIEANAYNLDQPKWVTSQDFEVLDKVTLPISQCEPTPPYSDKRDDIIEWITLHRGWVQDKERFKAELAQRPVRVRIPVTAEEACEIEISCALIDLRSDSTQYGLPISADMVLPKLSVRFVHQREQRLREGLTTYRLEEVNHAQMEKIVPAGRLGPLQLYRRIYPAGHAVGTPGVVGGVERYNNMCLQLVPNPPQLAEPLPPLPFNPESPAVTGACGEVAAGVRNWLEATAVFDPNVKASPAAPPGYVGKVQQVTERTITISLEGIEKLGTGDWVEVRCSDGTIPKAKVERADRNTAEAGTASINAGYRPRRSGFPNRATTHA